ncbi:hypothetical protein RhiirA5_444558 [Rhizophagus irregularis]|uniref:RNase H type-1 domain-containing protein n=1 Tax=Rhizophagus irregularis TaxID=588596 RepID=A0A2N0ND18_9GLOM|nr:hypothetical protein RhiirA5_444558 [Rhizophagus irregularis]
MTPKRLQKLNNILLWQAIRYIVQSLNLMVKLNKVQAHSENIYNDMADYSLAKEGYLKFNDEFIIDQNICKTSKKIINFSNFERQMSHCSLYNKKTS